MLLGHRSGAREFEGLREFILGWRRPPISRNNCLRYRCPRKITSCRGPMRFADVLGPQTIIQYTISCYAIYYASLYHTILAHALLYYAILILYSYRTTLYWPGGFLCPAIASRPFAGEGPGRGRQAYPGILDSFSVPLKAL